MTADQNQLRPCVTTPSLDLRSWKIPHPKPFVCAIRVGRELLNPMVPHVSNIEYVRWLDRVAELHSDSLGYTRPWLAERNLMWFVARHEVDYLAETWEADELLVATWVRDFRRVRSWRDYAILRPSDETVVCRASSLWVLVNLETRRPSRISEKMIDAFQPISRQAESAQAAAR